MPDSQIALRFLLPLIACVGALFVGWFITCDPNPLTTSIYVPVAVYGIWQQFFGLTSFEIDYLKSGYTIDIGLLDDVRLRPFSTLNSPHALSVVMAILSTLAFVVPLRGRRQAWWQLPVGLILAGGCIATFVRAGWVLFVLALIIWFCSWRRLTTFLMYGTIAAGFTILFIEANPLLNSLDRLDGVLPDSGDVENQAFRVGTFSDRLISFHNVMSNPAFHTWFGNRNSEELEQDSRENEAHDQIGQILISYGFAGLALFGAGLLSGLWFAHRAVFRQGNRLKRQILLGVLSVVLATILSGMLFGSHLGVFPIDVLFYLFTSMLFVAGRTGEHPETV